MNPELGGSRQIEWSQARLGQEWDPVPWWILDREKLEHILAVQVEFKLEAMKRDIELMEKIHKIVVGK